MWKDKMFCGSLRRRAMPPAAVGPTLNEQTKNFEPALLSQGAELADCLVKFPYIKKYRNIPKSQRI